MRLILFLFASSLLFSCAREAAAPAESPTPAQSSSYLVEPVPTPAAGSSGESHLTTARDGSVLMSWIERGEGRGSVKVARLSEGSWSEPATVVERDDLFINWADFPSVAEGADGTMFVHWLQKSGEGTYAYDVMMARSQDHGATWSEPVKLHDDMTQTEHGFVSLAPHPSEPKLAAVWLDGREMTGGHDHGGGDMTMRYATVSSTGEILEPTVLDERTCECCATAMAWTSSGPIVAYRDRSPEEIRDIAVVRREGSGWTQPAVVHADNWEIPGCPVNGPQLDARGNDVALAWFTAPGGDAKVLTAFSNDGGATWSAPVKIDEGSPIGRVDLVMLEDGTALAAWLETGAEGASIVVREIGPGGEPGAVTKVASTSSGRGSGFPRMTRAGDAIYVSWTELEPEKKVRMARLVREQGVQ